VACTGKKRKSTDPSRAFFRGTPGPVIDNQFAKEHNERSIDYPSDDLLGTSR